MSDERRAALLERAGAWLEHQPHFEVPRDLSERFALLQDWHRRLYDAGLLGHGRPEEFGGQGGSALDQLAVDSLLIDQGRPLPIGVVGLDLIVPVILEFGTQAQKEEHVAALLRGDRVWCQGFSEPDHGSDLATLATTAELDGDTYVINGAKVWTTLGQFSSWCAVLVRTGPPGSAHRGISYLLVPMDSPGIQTRPIPTITGEAEFCEVLFEDVRVPTSAVLGSVDGGWAVTMVTLEHERGPYLMRRSVELRATLERLLREAGTALGRDDDLLVRIGECRMLLVVMQAKAEEIATQLGAGVPQGARSSIAKVLIATVEQAVLGLALDLVQEIGEHGGWPAGNGENWARDYLYSRASSVYGGTMEIQKNIIAERVLGLPRAR